MANFLSSLAHITYALVDNGGGREINDLGGSGDRFQRGDRGVSDAVQMRDALAEAANGTAPHGISARDAGVYREGSASDHRGTSIGNCRA